MAAIFNRILKVFQTEGQLVHILHHGLKEIPFSLMGRFVKQDCNKEKSAHDLAKLDVEKSENLLSIEEMDVGEPTAGYLKKLGKNQSLLPRKEMQTFFKVVWLKLAQWFWRRFFILVNVFSLFHNYLPL